MKTNFINSLIKYFIEKYYYYLISPDNQPIDFSDGSTSLIKDVQGTSILLEIIDADRYSIEQLEQSMQRGAAFLENINGRNAYIYKLFLFDRIPELEKLEIIEQGQKDIVAEKKFLKCIMVNINDREVKKCFSVPTFDARISKSIKQFFSKKLDIRETSPQEVAELIAHRQKDFEIQLKVNKPWITYALIAINVAVWLILTLLSRSSGTRYDELLVIYGEKVNTLINNGEYWRFISPMFLHSNEIHLLVNCYSLFVIGSEVERLFGRARFLAIYFMSGFLGCAASFAFSITGSVGASGAIFGLLGAMLFFAMKKPSLLRSNFGANLITNIVINLAYGFMNKYIDNYGHVGGLIGGFLTTGIVYTAKEETSKDKLTKLLALISVIAISIGVLFYGFTSENNANLEKIDKVENYISQKDYPKAEKLAEEVLSVNPSDKDIQLRVLWNLTEAEEQLRKFNEAELHAKQLVEISPENGQFLLGVVYYNAQQFDKAEEQLQKARTLSPSYVEQINSILSDIKNRKGK